MAGMFLGGAKYRLPILIDGVTSAAAALIAVRLCPACSQTCFACHVSGEPAGPLLLQALGKQPLLTCGMRLGEATGAIAALPIIDMALTVYHSMGTFPGHPYGSLSAFGVITMLIFVYGGTASGKSAYAESLAASLAQPAPLIYLATMDASDPESLRRIARHRQQRAFAPFRTVEQPARIGQADFPQGAVVLVECLSTLTANELFLPRR